MKAIRFAQHGSSEVLRVVDVEEPHAGRGEIRIKVAAAGVNGLDWKLRAGHLREFMPVVLPAGLGMDGSGIVDEVGDGVEDVAVGDAVFGSGSNTYAEYAVLTHWAEKPSALSFAEAAGYGIPVATAQRVLDLVGANAGQTILVSGASGGVGSAVVQFAVAHGMRVIGTASETNQPYVEQLGAEAVLYGDGLVERIRAVSPDGVDAALDIAGSGIIPELVELTGDASKVVSIADFSAGEHGAQVSSGEGGDRRAALQEAAHLYETGRLHIPVAETFRLDQAGAAQTASETGHVAGRRVILLAEEPAPLPATTRITTIVHFTMPPENADEFFAFWQDHVRPSVVRQPGLIDGTFHRATEADGTYQFINVAHWETPELLEAGLQASADELNDAGFVVHEILQNLGVTVLQNNYDEVAPYWPVSANDD